MFGKNFFRTFLILFAFSDFSSLKKAKMRAKMGEMEENRSKNEPKSGRMVSVDALRGLDMLFIIGLDALVYRLAPLYPDNAAWRLIREQMGHRVWEGLTLYDTVFPLFVFLAGISMSFSLQRQMGSGRSIGRILGKLWWRALVLVMLGWIINGPLSWDTSQMRYASVLGLIGLSGALAGSWVVLSRSRMKGVLTAAGMILAAVGAAQWFGGDMMPGSCFNSKADTLLCPGVLHSGCYDPEGPLCILSACALSLLGYAGGLLLTRPDKGAMKRCAILLSAGILLMGAGMQLPVIKGIWTPGFVLSCGGIGMLLIGVLHPLTDVMGITTWCKPLVMVGSNALFIYMVTHLFSFTSLAERLSCGLLRSMLPAELHPAAYAAGALLLAWLLCLFLYRRGIFIRL